MTIRHETGPSRLRWPNHELPSRRIACSFPEVRWGAVVMGWIARATGCAFLLSATQANAGGRIAYPSPGQMYALLATDVRVFFSAPEPAARAFTATSARSDLFALAPMRRSFGGPISFEPSIRRYSMPVSIDPSPTTLDMRAESFRLDLFPEQQRARMVSPIDAMLTFSIGGSYGPNGNLCLEGGVAGALWRMSHPLMDTPASP